ncbi:hypothetical protein H4684_003809 [Desulfomicrobium macestii]|uniref:Uncharacterized protein n=1 Tax=Desulfomicrobium macestii TaxID=90731 RepID=A0ABR9H8T7_9BACT|nr:hypothetical protein [Desulfomicrobium macestii]MBE1427121.1 hypothetical protein [Desulfomicrobium macestii]
MRRINGFGLQNVLGILNQELVNFVKEGLPCWTASGLEVTVKDYTDGSGTKRLFTHKELRYPWDDKAFRGHISTCSFLIDETKAFLQEKHPEILEYLSSTYPPQDTAVSTPPTPTTEPIHDQQVEEKEPTDAASYVAWRRKKIRSIHEGQLMLEVQDRWGRPPEKTMDRAEIAALVRGEEPPSPNDTARRQSLENAFKYETNQYKKRLKN